MKFIFTTAFFTMLSPFNFAQDFSWAARYGGDFSYASAMTVDANGNTFNAVTYSGTVDFDPGAGELLKTTDEEGETTIQKLDENGNLVWTKTFISLSEDGIVGNSVEIRGMIADDDGNLYVTGGFTGVIDFDPGDGETIVVSTVAFNSDAFVMKLNEDGELIWVKDMGGECLDNGQSIKLDSNGDICLTGIFCGTVDFDPGPEAFELTSADEAWEIFVLKLSNDGDFIWAKSILSSSFDIVNNLTVGADNGIYICGNYSLIADFDPSEEEFTEVSEGTTEGYLLKLTSDGEFAWVNTISAELGSNIRSVDIDSEGAIYALGEFEGADIDFDPGDEVVSLSSMGEDDIFLVKYTADGSLTWVKQLASDLNDNGAQLEISKINTIYVVGKYQAAIDVDPGAGEFILEHTVGEEENFDLFLSTLSSDGEFLNAITFNSDRTNFVTSLMRGNEGSVYLSGLAFDELDINPSIDEFLINGTADQMRAFLLKLQDGNLSISEGKETFSLNVYPNPSHDNITVQLDKTYDHVKLELSDYSGRIIQTESYSQTQTINTSLDLPSGMYLLRLITEEGETVVKLIKE